MKKTLLLGFFAVAVSGNVTANTKDIQNEEIRLTEINQKIGLAIEQICKNSSTKNEQNLFCANALYSIAKEYIDFCKQFNNSSKTDDFAQCEDATVSNYNAWIKKKADLLHKELK